MSETTLTAEKAALERIEKERATHKMAARAFFNLLEELFPPPTGNDLAYWEHAVNRIEEVYVGAGKPQLLKHLLVGMMEYLEEVQKGGKANG